MRRSVRSSIALLVLATPVIAQDWTQIPLDTTADLYAVENTYLPKHWVVGVGLEEHRCRRDLVPPPSHFRRTRGTGRLACIGCGSV